MKSSMSSAVVLVSTETGLSSGAAGAFTLAHSSKISAAWAGSMNTARNAAAAIKLYFMNILHERDCLLGGGLWAGSCASTARPVKAGRDTPPLDETPVTGEYCDDRRRHLTLRNNEKPEGTLHEYQGRQTSDRRGNAEAQKLGTLGQGRPDRHPQPRHP